MQALGSLGLILIVVLGVLGIAVTGWVFWPAFRGPDAARKAIGTYRLALGAFLALLVINAAIDLPLTPVLARSGIPVTPSLRRLPGVGRA